MTAEDSPPDVILKGFCISLKLIMRRLNVLLLLIFNLALASPLFTQQTFDELYRRSSPSRGVSDIDSIKFLCQEFLDQAIAENDSQKIVIALLYKINSFVISTEYPLAMETILIAEDYTQAMKDTLLMARVNHKKGAVHSHLQNYQESIKYYKLALEQSMATTDSYNIAITLEQLGRMSINTNEYHHANEYFRKAIPLIKKHGRKTSLTTAYSNYGIALVEQDSFQKAIHVYKSAMELARDIKDDYELIPAQQNLAYLYYLMDSLDHSYRYYKQSQIIDEKNGWHDYLMFAYKGLGMVHEKKELYDSSLFYFQKYHHVKDSIIGQQVQNKVDRLEKEAELADKELQLVKIENEKIRAERKLVNFVYTGILILFLLGGVLYYYKKRARFINMQLVENRKSLQNLTTILISKNLEIRSLSERIKNNLVEINQSSGAQSIDLNLYDTTILTDSDWETFKLQFENSYPKFIQNVRNQFPGITQAEERLLIFIRLKISSKESANILGVQVDSIKKTRNRLRKKLNLERDENLNEFIQTL